MKKIILTVLLIAFTAMSAEATTFVRYNPGGSVVSVRRGYHNPTASFGSNARFTPANRRIVRRPARPARPYRCRYEDCYGRRGARTVVNGSRRIESAPMSRFNKNYTISTQKSYTRNGITYYE